jgi:hypothetical protein
MSDFSRGLTFTLVLLFFVGLLLSFSPTGIDLSFDLSFDSPPFFRSACWSTSLAPLPSSFFSYSEFDTYSPVSVAFGFFISFCDFSSLAGDLLLFFLPLYLFFLSINFCSSFPLP